MWTHLPRVGFDTETTGIDTLHERLVTCSIVVEEKGTHSSHYWLANPGIPIPEAATAVHGIDTTTAEREGRPPTEVLHEISDLLISHLAAGYPVVAFNASYDFTLLEAELARHGLPTLTSRLGHPPYPVIDPYQLDRSLDRYRRGKRRLADLCAVYGAEGGDFHNAQADVLATLNLLEAMLTRYPALAEHSLKDLHTMASEAHAEFLAFLSRKGSMRGHVPLRPPRHWPLEDAVLSEG